MTEIVGHQCVIDEWIEGKYLKIQKQLKMNMNKFRIQVGNMTENQDKLQADQTFKNKK